MGAAWLGASGVVAFKKLVLPTEQQANALRLNEAGSYSYTPTGEPHPASVAVRLLPGCPCTLKLWEAQGPRTFTLEDVTFPEGKAEEP